MTEASSKTQGKAAGVAKPAAAKRASGKPAVQPPQPSREATGKGIAKPGAKPVRRPSAVDEAVSKHHQVLAEALEQAQAIQYAPPRRQKAAAKADKPAKTRKLKLVRDSFAMPEAEYARIGELKKRLGGAVKKSELLRAGLAALCALDDAGLEAALGRIERIKTGRPSKK
ncbi:MAG: hypothetical protein FWF20_03040 [Betaproteobacteria bacterium]|nr:hypothetical protein [Betaproteobacteria bacterium]MCL2885759.1 hypothetical protein [Betaproteobacteria bacterium]